MRHRGKSYGSARFVAYAFLSIGACLIFLSMMGATYILTLLHNIHAGRESKSATIFVREDENRILGVTAVSIHRIHAIIRRRAGLG